jgi:hypothetical protein
VIDDSGNPLPGASASIQSESGAVSPDRRWQTGDDGRVSINGLIAGEPVKCLFKYNNHNA